MSMEYIFERDLSIQWGLVATIADDVCASRTKLVMTTNVTGQWWNVKNKW